jgi:hypothetical protein
MRSPFALLVVSGTWLITSFYQPDAIRDLTANHEIPAERLLAPSAMVRK